MLDNEAWHSTTADDRASLQAEAYGARLERVVAARSAVEQRLHKRLDLLDGYARVVNMIEIEAPYFHTKASLITVAYSMPTRTLST